MEPKTTVNGGGVSIKDTYAAKRNVKTEQKKYIVCIYSILRNLSFSCLLFILIYFVVVDGLLYFYFFFIYFFKFWFLCWLISDDEKDVTAVIVILTYMVNFV